MTGPERMSELLERLRPGLQRYLTRMVVRPEIAEELVQLTAVRALEAPLVPEDDEGARRWLFRIATNAAIDELRRHPTWRESAIQDARKQAEADPEFVAASLSMRGSAETKAIAREHLAFCFSCTLRGLEPRRAATLLLREVYAFTIDEIAEILGEPRTRIKNWLQEARRTMDARYAATCALVGKKGVCYQCSELAEFFQGAPENPLAGIRGRSRDRGAIVRELEESGLGPWHRMLVRVFDDID